MKKSYPYLNDKDFLKILDEQKVKEQLVKITVLDWNENPINEIQGRAVSGNLNLDGKSSIRRTCNLTMVVTEQEFDYNNIKNLISINKKVFLEIGIKNMTSLYTEEKYIWFPQGLFIIMGESLSHNTSGTTVSLQLKDKMVLLNGECGGTLPAAVTFHEIENFDEEGNSEITNPTIYQIILELVNHFGEQQLGKIIISGVDTRIKQVMKWTGSDPLYLIRYVDENETVQYTPTLDDPAGTGVEYYMYPLGHDVGYIYTDFIYPGELISNAGDTVCTILDTIKNTLGNYEYFFDVFGNFIFQEIQNYLNTTQATFDLEKINNSNYLVDMTNGKKAYSFDDSNLITSYSNSPQFNMIKNDFIVWGKRKTITDEELPIRYHLAIDTKPIIGNKYNVVFYEDPDDNLIKARAAKEDEIGTLITTKDWRSELYLSGVVSELYATDSNFYYIELMNEWTKLYDLQKGQFLDEVKAYPFNIDYFLDFIDSSSALGEFSVQNIGRRSKVIVDDKINCVFEPAVPDLVLIEIGGENQRDLINECMQRGQEYVQVPSDIYSLINLGGTFNSAFNMIKDLLYQYTNYNETVNLQAIPIYYLEPNIRIGIHDEDSGIFGDYIIQNISLPLDINGTMSISAIKALNKI